MHKAGGRRIFAVAALSGLALTACQTVRPGTPARYAECDKLIAAYGKARPGFLNAEEWGERDWDRFRGIYDTNGDGKVDFDELYGRFPPPPNVPDVGRYERERMRSFRRMDQAGKGYIDRADVIRGATGGFRLQDRNRDGWLSRDECAAIHPPPLELV